MPEYEGPPEPSGTFQSMYSLGILIEQHLQCRQFWAFIWSLASPGFSSSSMYSYTLAGQNLCSGAANCFQDMLLGVFSWPPLIFRWDGWSWSWFVPDLVRLVSRSKVNTSSCFGYSISLCCDLGSVYSASFFVWARVQGSLPFVVYWVKAPCANPWNRPLSKPDLKFLVWCSSSWTQESSNDCWILLIYSPPISPSLAWCLANISSAAIMPVFIALWDPLILATFRKPAEHPASIPPGKWSWGTAWRPPSLRHLAP